MVKYNIPGDEYLLKMSIILTRRPCWPPGTSSSPTLPSPTSSSALSPCRYASPTSSPITGLLEQTLWVWEIAEHYLSGVQKTLQWCQLLKVVKVWCFTDTDIVLKSCAYILKAKKFAEPLFSVKKNLRKKCVNPGVIFGPFGVILVHFGSFLGHLGSFWSF